MSYGGRLPSDRTPDRVKKQHSDRTPSLDKVAPRVPPMTEEQIWDLRMKLTKMHELRGWTVAESALLWGAFGLLPKPDKEE